MDSMNNFISTLMIAVSNCSLYTPGHSAFNDLANRALASLDKILDKPVTIMIIDNELIVNNILQRDGDIHKINLIKRLRRKGLTRIDFLKGIALSEIKQFIIDMSGSGKSLSSFKHIRAGAVDLNLVSQAASVEPDAFTSPDILDKVKEIFQSASHFQKLNVTGLEEVVGHFINTDRKEASILKYLYPVKSCSDYTYTHASNVAVLSVFQAESLNIKGDLLHDIGVAGLLHDVGKLFISAEILEKKGSLDDREFKEIKKHPLYGAGYLAKNRDLTPLASIIAFEHHLKYDCSGYPSLSLNGRTQHILSQIAALADFFDALRSHRPYRGSMDAKDIFVIMKKGTGTDFNPFLLDNFMRIIHEAKAA
jgi:HD-GYP domain-containing protein (c-di-GMP phosphodiesterase class II)